VRDKLRANNVAWCVSDTDEADAPMFRTADFAYLRLRKLVYDDDALKRWSATIGETLDDGCDVFVYFKHEDTPSGAFYAVQMRELVGRVSD
jgi:uncharacterized protein YecE (DUF72 family)